MRCKQSPKIEDARQPEKNDPEYEVCSGPGLEQNREAAEEEDEVVAEEEEWWAVWA